MKTYKNCDGKKIDKCKNCSHFKISLLPRINHKLKLCKKAGLRLINNSSIIQDWCPLPDLKEKEIVREHWDINEL